jgi:riboflavin transporter FmnP
VTGGFMFGPLAAFTLAAVTALVEMITLSQTSVWGMLMNLISSASFAVPAAVIYKYRRSLPGAVVGLVSGIVIVVPVMLLWNYIMVPIYAGWPRAAVAEMLIPVFLPFNLIKYGLNAALALMVYKPIVTALMASGLYRPDSQKAKGRINLGVMLAAAFVVISLVLVILVLQGIL